jgi:type IV secretory pathway VirD2 relaxase
MPKRLIDVGREPGMLLDIASYARRGPGRRDQLSPAEIEVIARTVHRTPEVMVKVLNRGGQSLGAVARHIDYLSRKGELEIETDEGERLKGKGAEAELLDDWDLDLDEERRTADLKPRGMRDPPKLVQKLVFSMPAGTPPQKVLSAVKNFAREEFGARHRYAMVLHTDEPHPHVHFVVKAMGADGKRLNIRRETLRKWRQGFARHLRAQGVAANATPRQVRGEIKPPKTDGIYRAALRGASTHHRERADAVARELAGGQVKSEPGKNRLLETRREVVRGWNEVADRLVTQGQVELALSVRQFVGRMPPPRTENEQIAEKWREAARERTRRQMSR